MSEARKLLDSMRLVGGGRQSVKGAGERRGIHSHTHIHTCVHAPTIFFNTFSLFIQSVSDLCCHLKWIYTVYTQCFRLMLPPEMNIYTQSVSDLCCHLKLIYIRRLQKNDDHSFKKVPFFKMLLWPKKV